jgi:hypothetical protein
MLKVIEKDGILVWATVSIWDKTIFIERDINATIEDVKLSLKILESEKLHFNNDLILCFGNFFVYTLWRFLIDEVVTYNTAVEVLEPSNIYLKSYNWLNDDWNIQKSNWRYSLLKFTENTFNNWLSNDENIIFMPWLWGQEYDLWNSFWIMDENMFLLEWEWEKIKELTKIHPTSKLINSFYGANNSDFVSSTSAIIWDEKVSIISLDTESIFSEELFYQTVQLLLELNLTDNFILSLNLASRFSHNKAINFINSFNLKYWTNYSVTQTPRAIIMKNLWEMLSLATDNRIKTEKSETSSYLWGSSSRMEYTFIHFKVI